MNSPTKSCSLGPLFLSLSGHPHHPVTSIINASLEQGKCPNFFKQVHVTPILKNHPLLGLKISVILANVLVSSRLDYCNSLFVSLTNFELKRLQLVQNSLCRVVTRSSKFSHITPQLKKKLHWRTDRFRIQFEKGLITYKILNQDQPAPITPKRINSPQHHDQEMQDESPPNSSSFIPPLSTESF